MLATLPLLLYDTAGGQSGPVHATRLAPYGSQAEPIYTLHLFCQPGISSLAHSRLMPGFSWSGEKSG